MRRLAIAGAAVLMLAGSVGISAQGRQATVEVYKSPTCGCCSKWADHLRSHGFQVRVTDTETVDQLKTKYGVPRQARSCHTALVGGYVIEGHVPAADVQRLLKDRPAVVGIAVPGMPIGSPGMEGGSKEAYEVLTFDATGKTTVFARR